MSDKMFPINGEMAGDALRRTISKMSHGVEHNVNAIMEAIDGIVKICVDEEINNVLESICDDLDVYIDWHKHLSEVGERFDPEIELVKAKCYKIAKKQVMFRMIKKGGIEL